MAYKSFCVGVERQQATAFEVADQEPPAVGRHPAAGKLADIFRFEFEGDVYLGTLIPLGFQVGDGWTIGAAVPEDDFLGEVKKGAAKTTGLSVAITLFSMIIATIIGRRITRPLREIAEETRRIRSLEFDDRPFKDSMFDEMSEILHAYASMKIGLRAFQKYVPMKLVRILLESGEDPKLGGKTEDLTIFFSDIKGFSTFAEKMDPTELAETLGEYLEVMANTIIGTNGTVDKYVGDAVVAMWNAPRPVEDHAFQGVIAALRCQESIAKLKHAGLLYTRIGLHSEKVMVGNFGSPDRLNYTMLGDGVNLAARLEGVNREYGTNILTTDAIYEQVKDRVACRKIDRIAVKGKLEPTEIYEVIGEQGEIDEAHLASARLYEEGLEAYFGQRFAAAIDCFAQAIEADPQDEAASVMRQRCEDYLESPPPANWDGVHIMKTK